MKKKTDIQVSYHGNIYMFMPLTPKADQWVKDHLELEPWQWFGKSFSVDQHCAANLVQGMQKDGMIVT